MKKPILIGIAGGTGSGKAASLMLYIQVSQMNV